MILMPIPTPVACETLVGLFDYSQYASKLLVNACAALPEETLRLDRGSSHGGLLGTLQHTYYADRMWLSRFEGAPRAKFVDDGDGPSLAAMQPEWMAVLDRFKAYIVRLGQEGVEAEFTFRNLAGNEYTMPRWQALQHVVNHATYHRGQIVTMLRQAGAPGVATDLLYYYLR